MKDEVQSMFDEFETDEETGEVLVPRAVVGTVPSEKSEDTEETSNETETKDTGIEEIETEETETEETEIQEVEEELPELHFDFEFGEEEFVTTEENEIDEDAILKSIDDALATQMAATLGPVEEPKKGDAKKKKKKNVWRRIPLWCRILLIVLLSLSLLLGFLVGTKPGRSLVVKLAVEYFYSRVNVDESTPTPEPVITQAPITPEPTQSAGVNPGTVTGTPAPTATPVPTVEPRKEKYCYNVLLIGVEALPQLGGGGRSDSMILVSVNSKEKKIHMTSFMRDMYVQIPGHADNRLNAAYAKGGAQLLVDTIELNFQVKIDGYVKVGFESFEWIVNRLGGVEITLTADEAAYLQKTDYISNPAYRNVVSGPQLMNGNQVLGYCRVRMVPTANGTSSDFGRTERQRTVLTKIFNKYKNSNIFTMLNILNECLPMITTNIPKATMQDMLTTVVEERILSLDNMRLPISGGYSGVRLVDENGDPMEVLQVQWKENINALHEYVFGSVE